jgi:pimeloyl-ACP methyl ester carboxylesterase
VPLPGEAPEACVRRIAAAGRVRHVDFGGGDMVCREWGEGPAVVFLHGGYGTWMHWIRNVLPLSQRCRVIAADLPSHGESDALPGRLGRTEVSAAVARALRAVVGSDEAFTLVGFSMGANLSAAIVDSMGRQPAKLIVVGAGGLGVSSKKIVGLQRWRPDLPRDELDRRHRKNLGVIMFRDAARIDELAVHVQRENGLRMRFHLRRDGANTMLRDFLPRVAAPLACIWGDADVYAEGNRGRRVALMRQTHPDLECRIVPDAGHWVMYEQAEAFNAVLADLIAG